jgi:hypothetical protein
MRIGRKLMNLVLGELGDRCTLLNATVAGQPLYESLGFKAIGTPYTSIRARWPPSSRLHCRREKASAWPKPGDIARIIELANRKTPLGYRNITGPAKRSGSLGTRLPSSVKAFYMTKTHSGCSR